MLASSSMTRTFGMVLGISTLPARKRPYADTKLRAQVKSIS